MNDKYAKAIAKELRLIRVELQKSNKSVEIDLPKFSDAIAEQAFNGQTEVIPAGTEVRIGGFRPEITE